MSEILNLAKGFEEKSRQLAGDTARNLQSEFERHEQFISEALKSSEQKISVAINDRNQRLSRLVLRSWSWLLLTVITVTIACWGVIWYQGHQISDNWKMIAEQKRAIAQMRDQGGNLIWNTCGDSGKKCLEIDTKAGSFGEHSQYMIPKEY